VRVGWKRLQLQLVDESLDPILPWADPLTPDIEEPMADPLAPSSPPDAIPSLDDLHVESPSHQLSRGTEPGQACTHDHHIPTRFTHPNQLIYAEPALLNLGDAPPPPPAMSLRGVFEDLIYDENPVLVSHDEHPSRIFGHEASFRARIELHDVLGPGDSTMTEERYTSIIRDGHLFAVQQDGQWTGIRYPYCKHRDVLSRRTPQCDLHAVATGCHEFLRRMKPKNQRIGGIGVPFRAVVRNRSDAIGWRWHHDLDAPVYTGARKYTVHPYRDSRERNARIAFCSKGHRLRRSFDSVRLATQQSQDEDGDTESCD
jgi:hypothetical protein